MCAAAQPQPARAAGRRIEEEGVEPAPEVRHDDADGEAEPTVGCVELACAASIDQNIESIS